MANMPMPAALGLQGRDFKLLIAATLSVMSNFAPLMTVAPMWTATAGAGPSGMGAVTAIMMAATVTTQLAMPWLLRRLALRQLFAIGGLLMGVPTFGFLLSAELPWVLAVSLLRGAGFGLVTVAGSALAAELVPVSQRGKAVGAYGAAVGTAQLLVLPAGVWVAQHVGYGPVFVVVGLLAIAAAPAMWAMSGQRVADTESDFSSAVSWRTKIGKLVGPWSVMLAVACAFGGLLTFLPLAVGDESIAPLALFAMSAGVVAGRGGAGVLTDKFGEGRLLLPASIATSLGMFAMGWSSANDLGIVTACLAVTYGLGFGALQNDSLVVLFHRCGPGNGGFASVVWNVAYDAGIGMGGIMVGGIAASVESVSGAFVAVAVIIVVLTPLAWHSGRVEARKRTAMPGKRTPR